MPDRAAKPEAPATEVDKRLRSRIATVVEAQHEQIMRETADCAAERILELVQASLAGMRPSAVKRWIHGIDPSPDLRISTVRPRMKDES